MRHQPAVWHFGLMSEYWTLFKRETPELPGLLSTIQRFGQPVLDLACGTGRVLLGLLRHGVDADGIDVSADMIAHAKSAAALEGRAPSLHVQPMHDFSSDRSYRTIVIVDSFGLGGNRDQDRATLRRCHAALRAGGALILNIQMEYTSTEAWALWSPIGRASLPEPWPEREIERVAPNGDVYRLRIRTTSASAIRQSFTREMRIEKWVDGERRAEETATLAGNMYLPSEVIASLREAGFSRVELRSGFTDLPATDDSSSVVFIAEKNSAA